MSLSVTENAAILPMNGKRLNPAELKIDLLCRGVHIDATCRIVEEGRPVCSRPADLASGVELILPGEMRELWVNAPINEKFVKESPYRLLRASDGYHLRDERHDLTYSVKLAPKPDWYDLRTTRGIPMAQVGMLQGTFLLIDLGESCRFWDRGKALNCRFCRIAEQDSGGIEDKTVEDVVETAAMAHQRSGITFALLRGGYQGAGGLARIFPYLKALKQEAGILVVVQFPPEADLRLYDQARSLGVDHFSFCMEFFNKDYLERLAPGKSAALGREHFLQAIEYSVRIMGKGRVSGEIIAGIEPIEDTLRAIDYLTGVGALPLVSIFRPLQGTEMESEAPPNPAEMIGVFRHVYEACRSTNLPIGLAPNVNLSVLPHPEDTLYLASDSLDGRAYQRWIFTMKQVMRPYFLRRMRKHAPPLQK
ncbi:MAG: hypothetical protein LAP85_12020 [Acidobacteriia bacterium]|nr:hypothetical protein [Terriglobia bacterium]